MKSSFPSIELKERHENILQYQLPSHACCLARVFDLLSNNFEELGVVDFSVSQTTLDQVRMRVMDEGRTSVYKGPMASRCCPQGCNNLLPRIQRYSLVMVQVEKLAVNI